MKRDGSSSFGKLAVVVLVGGGVVFALSALKRETPAPTTTAAAGTAPAGVTHRVDARGATTAPAPARDKPAVNPHDPAVIDAAAAGNLDGVKALADKGVLLDGTLGVAAHSGNAELVGWLLDHGVDPHEGETGTAAPLLEGDAYPTVAAALLAHGAAEPSLEDAVVERAPACVTRLVGKGADPHDQLARGVSQVREERGVPTLAALLSKGAHVDGVTLVAGLDLDASLKDGVRDRVLDMLLANPLEKDATLTGVMHAALAHDAPALKKVAAKGVGWTLMPRDEEPPLVVAARALDVDSVTALLDAKEPVDQVASGGDTALQAVLAAHGNAYGRDVDEVDQIVKALLDHGANPNRKLSDGRTPRDVAEGGNLDASARVLAAHGGKKSH
jgi:ankyrin repeat protein